MSIQFIVLPDDLEYSRQAITQNIGIQEVAWILWYIEKCGNCWENTTEQDEGLRGKVNH